MFGILVAGRMIQTNFERVGDKQFLITIPEADSINYIGVFMTGTLPFPDGTAGLVYFSWPDPESPPQWQLTGYLSNEKPSCVFKISTLKRATEQQAGVLQFQQQNVSHVAQIGISVEPIDVVQQQMTLIDRTSQNQALFTEFPQKMLQNFVNFISSFAVTQAQMTPTPNETFVPLSVLQTWYQNFQRRLDINPTFWQAS